MRFLASFFGKITLPFLPPKTSTSRAAEPSPGAKEPPKKVVNDPDTVSQIRRSRLASLIHETMHAQRFNGDAFRFKILPISNSGYEFIALVDVVQPIGKTAMELTHLGAKIMHDARCRFGILVKGVYWQISGEARTSPSAPAKAVSPTTSIKFPREATKAEREFDDEMRLFAERSAAARSGYSRPMELDSTVPTQEEIAEFNSALKDSGGTQYGSLH